MSASHHFSRGDADRILRRAAEIEGADDERRMSLAELRAIAGEAGFSPQTVERAIADVQTASLAASRQTPVKKSGIVMAHLSTVREIPVGLDGDQLMRVVRLFSPYREGPTQVKLDDDEITWRDRKGVRFAIASVGGLTEVRVYVSGILFRRGRWFGWVKAAADRLEMLALLVAGQRSIAGEADRARLPAPPGPEFSGNTGG